MKSFNTSTNNRPADVAFPYKGGIHFIPAENIIRLEADSNYTYIYSTHHRPILMAKVLAVYEAMLEPLGFIRTHRSHLINAAHIAYVSRGGQIIMKDDSKAEISRRKRKEIIHALTVHHHTA